MQFTQLFIVGIIAFLLRRGDAAVDYKQALTNSLLYFEAQRSGKLPSNQRVQWRDNSGLRDGQDAKVSLSFF